MNRPLGCSATYDHEIGCLESDATLRRPGRAALQLSLQKDSMQMVPLSLCHQMSPHSTTQKIIDFVSAKDAIRFDVLEQAGGNVEL